jgi:hypothetical protein
MKKVKHLMKRIITKIKSNTLITHIISVWYAEQQIIFCLENDQEIELSHIMKILGENNSC